MNAKIVRIAAVTPSAVKTSVMSNCPSVEKSGAICSDSGACVTPNRYARIAVTTMLMISAPGTLRT